MVQSGASLGVLAGGLLLTLLGNPAKVVWITIALETLICVSGALVGAFTVVWVLVPLLLVYSATVAFCDGTVMTLWQRKIRPEFQGRVFVLKDAPTTALMPLGALIFSPIAEVWFEPNLLPSGAWTSGIGAIVGVGPGRGMGFLFIVSNALCLPIVALALMSKRLRRVDTEIPDQS